MRSSQKGSITPLIVFIIVALVIGGGMIFYSQNKSLPSITDSSATTTITSNTGAGSASSGTKPTTTPSGADSGFMGTATIGPSCPVARVDDPCDDKPYSTTFDLRTKAGILIKQFQSDANGKFKVTIDPGEYMIKESKPRTFPKGSASTAVTVNPHVYTTVNLQFDSGIR